jgi:hypothetical protein
MMKLYVSLTKHYATKFLGEWMHRSGVFLTKPVVGDEWSASRPGCFAPMSGQLHSPAALSLGNSSRYSLDGRMGEPQSWSG